VGGTGVVGVRIIVCTASVLCGTTKQGRAVLRCEGECLSSRIMDRRKGQPCTTRKRKWHRALFSATRKRGKSDPLSPPYRAIGRRQRQRSSRERSSYSRSIPYLREVIQTMRTAHQLRCCFFGHLLITNAATRQVLVSQAQLPLHALGTVIGG
jgi:hypothetical protein